MKYRTKFIRILMLGWVLTWYMVGLVAIAQGGEKVTICHVPPSHDVTITVSTNALDAHLAHGDYVGPCLAPSQPPSTQPSTEPSGSIGEPTQGTQTPCWQGCHTSRPPHEHITQPPTDTESTTPMAVNTNAAFIGLFAIALLLCGTLLSLRRR